MNGKQFSVILTLVIFIWVGSQFGRMIGNKFLGTMFGFSGGCYVVGTKKR